MPRLKRTSTLNEFHGEADGVFFGDGVYDDRRPIDRAQCCIGRARLFPASHGFGVCIGAIPQVAAVARLVVGCIRTRLLMRRPPIRGSVFFKADIVGKRPSETIPPPNQCIATSADPDLFSKVFEVAAFVSRPEFRFFGDIGALFKFIFKNGLMVAV